jgi:hypothetical protein
LSAEKLVERRRIRGIDNVANESGTEMWTRLTYAIEGCSQHELPSKRQDTAEVYDEKVCGLKAKFSPVKVRCPLIEAGWRGTVRYDLDLALRRPIPAD